MYSLDMDTKRYAIVDDTNAVVFIVDAPNKRAAIRAQWARVNGFMRYDGITVSQRDIARTFRAVRATAEMAVGETI